MWVGKWYDTNMSSMAVQEPVTSVLPPEPDAHCFPPFSNARVALDEIDADGPDKLSADSLRGDIWLQDKLHLTHNAAYSQIRTARQLERLPRTFPALRQGQINWQQVSVICGAMEEVTKTKLDPVQVESALVSAAQRWTPRRCSCTGSRCATRATRKRAWRLKKNSAAIAGCSCGRPGRNDCQPWRYSHRNDGAPVEC
jgi:hypothetical protein